MQGNLPVSCQCLSCSHLNNYAYLCAYIHTGMKLQSSDVLEGTKNHACYLAFEKDMNIFILIFSDLLLLLKGIVLSLNAFLA